MEKNYDNDNYNWKIKAVWLRMGSKRQPDALQYWNTSKNDKHLEMHLPIRICHNHENVSQKF